MSDVIELTAASEPTITLEVGSDGVSPSQFAKLEKWLRDQWSAVEAEADVAIDGAESVDATVTKVDDTATITITDRNGTVHRATVTDGKDATIADDSIDWDKLAPDVTNPLDRLMYRLSNMLTATPAEAEVVTATDAAKTPPAGLSLYGRSTQDGTPTPDAPVPIVSVGAANLLPNLATSKTQNGVTFTANEDGSISLSGTATANTALLLWRQNQQDLSELSGQVVTLSGGVSGSIYLVFYDTANHVSNANNVTFTVGTIADTGTEGASSRAFLYVTSGTVTDGTTVRPMLNAGSTACPYVPYGHAGLWAKRTSDASVYTVTPIDLDGHELRSLPDGTRDELTVDADGHAVLIQRVGVLTVDGSNYVPWVSMSGTYTRFGLSIPNVAACIFLADKLATTNNYDIASLLTNPYSIATNTDNRVYFSLSASETTVDQAKALLQSNPVTINYKLATPQTIDLGTIDPVPLVGPDLTAQAVPTAPFALTYERDLNVTLARLEAAIAALA